MRLAGGSLAATKACVAAPCAAGKRVLTLSNSGKRAEDNMRRLEGLGLPRWVLPAPAW